YTLAEAHASVAALTGLYDWDWPEAENKFKLAIEVDPAYGTTHQWYANCLAGAGQFDRAISEIGLAQKIEPTSPIIIGTSGLIMYFAGKYDQAIEQCLDAVNREPYFFVGHVYLGYAYRQKGMYQEALKEFETARTLSKHNQPLDNQTVIGELGYS